MAHLAAALVAVAIVAQACGAAASPTPAPSLTTAAPASATPSVALTPTATPTTPTATPGIPTPPGSGIVLAMADVPRAPVGPNDLDRAAAALDAFGLELLQRIGSDGGSVVVSPASIVIALGMARAGARGETATEMDRVLHAAGLDELVAELNALDQALASRSGWIKDGEGNPREVTLRSANAPFAQRGYALDPAYLDLLASRFGAGLRLVDFIADPEAARWLINGWVSERTEQRIPELLAPPDITDLTRLVLVNAIYLKAPWREPFDPELTKPGPFTLADGSRVEVPMMHLVSTGLGPDFPAGSGDDWRAIRLPYLGNQLALTVIVPDDLGAFVDRLTPTMLADLTTMSWEREGGLLDYHKVDLALPRFSTETEANLADLLKAMGMPLAFDPTAADFSGITTEDRLYIARVIHQANIDVDEKGTEAAAATAVVMDVGGPGEPFEPFVIRVDRPFLFVLTDVPSGAILFLGQVADPSAG